MRATVRLHIARRILPVAFLALGAATAYGAEWQVIPRIEAGLTADSNYGMATDSGAEREAFGGLLDARVGFVKVTPVSRFEIAPFVGYQYFTNIDENGKRGGANIRFDKQGLRSAAGIRADYTIDELLETGLRAGNGEDLGNQDEVELDFITTRNRRDRLQVRPQMRFSVSQRSALEFGANYTDVDYDRREPGQQEGYASYGAQAGIAHDRNPRSQLGLALQYAEFHPDADGGMQVGANARTTSLLGRWTTRLAERRQYYFQAGVQRTGYFGSDLIDRDSATTYSGGLGARWEWLTSTLYVDAIRSIQPNSIGEVVAQNELRTRLTRELRPRLQGTAWARYVDAEALKGSQGGDRRLAGLGIDLTWQMSRQTSVVGAYDYSRKEYGAGASAGSHAARISIVYERLRQL